MFRHHGGDPVSADYMLLPLRAELVRPEFNSRVRAPAEWGKICGLGTRSQF
jgi:hypothetical protein